MLLASIPAGGLPCLQGVDRFASRSGLDFYYHCDRPGEEAIEVQCPHDQLFSRKGSRCIASKTFEIQVIHCQTCICPATKSELTRASDPSSENGIRLEPVLGRSARLGLNHFKIELLLGVSFDWSRPKSVEDGKIPTKKVKAKVSHKAIS